MLQYRSVGSLTVDAVDISDGLRDVMTPPSAQSTQVPLLGTILLWGLAVLALPYLLDVAFIGDLTPTHYAQESIDAEDAQDTDGKAHTAELGEKSVPSSSLDLLAGQLSRLRIPEPVGSPPLLGLGSSLASRPPPAI